MPAGPAAVVTCRSPHGAVVAVDRRSVAGRAPLGRGRRPRRRGRHRAAARGVARLARAGQRAAVRRTGPLPRSDPLRPAGTRRRRNPRSSSPRRCPRRGRRSPTSPRRVPRPRPRGGRPRRAGCPRPATRSTTASTSSTWRGPTGGSRCPSRSTTTATPGWPPTAGRSSRPTTRRRCGTAAAGGSPLMGVIMSKEFHRALDVDGSMKGKAWDFVMKLSRDADLTGLDLKMPKGAADRRVRTARVDDNFRAVLFAVGDESQPMWLLAAIKPHDDAYRHAETLTLTVNPANGAMEVLATEAVRREGRRLPQAPGRRRRCPASCRSRSPSSSALGINAEVAAEAVRLTERGRRPRARRGPARMAATGAARPRHRHVARRRPLDLRAGRAHHGRRPGRGGRAPDEPHAVRLPRQRRRAAPHDGGRLRRLAHLPAPDAAGRRPPRDLQRALPARRRSRHRQDRRRPAPCRVPRPPARCPGPALHLHPQPRGEPGGRPALAC